MRVVMQANDTKAPNAALALSAKRAFVSVATKDRFEPNADLLLHCIAQHTDCETVISCPYANYH